MQSLPYALSFCTEVVDSLSSSTGVGGQLHSPLHLTMKTDLFNLFFIFNFLFPRYFPLLSESSLRVAGFYGKILVISHNTFA